jgi:Domain of unknown function (DUF6471)
VDTINPIVNTKCIEYDGLSIEFRGYMVDKDWQEKVKGMLKAELKRRNLSYKDLAEKLSAIGVQETEANIKNKISRGGFTAVFLVQCLQAIGAKQLLLD